MSQVDVYMGEGVNGEQQVSVKGEGEEEGRDRWTSRLAFVLGAIGSAVGLGNLWRFPAKAYANGGVSFLIPYGAAFFIFGIPLLFLELLLGRHFQGGDPVCFGSIDARLKGIGWTSVFNSFMIASYYNVIIAYALIYFVNSFKSPMPWANRMNFSKYNETSMEFDIINETDRPATFFFNDVLQISESYHIQETFNGWLVFALILTWVMVFLSIFKGVQVVSKVVLISVPLPLIMLVVLLINNLTREGAADGVVAYLGIPDWEKLGNSTIWQEAISQIFFSIGVCFGVMTAYSSYRDPKEPVLVDTFLIAGFNSFISLFAGFVVFTTLGIYGVQQGQPIVINGEKNPLFDGEVGGIGLVFVTYPASLALFEGATGTIMSIIFFGVIFLLALDSAFSIVEAVTTAMHDSPFGQYISREMITLYVCGACFTVSIFYAMDNGLYLLDAIDYYINNYGMLLLGALESIAAGWVYQYVETEREVGVMSMRWFAYGYWGSVALTIIVLVFGQSNWGFIFVLGIPASVVMSYKTCEDDSLSVNQFLEKVVFYGVKTFTDLMFEIEFPQAAVQGGLKYKFAQWFAVFWSICIKYIIPTLVMFLVTAGAYTDYNELYEYKDENDVIYLSSYEGYEGGLLNIGRIMLVIGAGIEILFYVLESAYIKAGVGAEGAYVPQHRVAQPERVSAQSMKKETDPAIDLEASSPVYEAEVSGEPQEDKIDDFTDDVNHV